MTYHRHVVQFVLASNWNVKQIFITCSGWQIPNNNSIRLMCFPVKCYVNWSLELQTDLWFRWLGAKHEKFGLLHVFTYHICWVIGAFRVLWESRGFRTNPTECVVRKTICLPIILLDSPRRLQIRFTFLFIFIMFVFYIYLLFVWFYHMYSVISNARWFNGSFKIRIQ